MTAHTAADIQDSRMSTWLPTMGSADADLLGELPRITTRSRDLVRNNPIAAGVEQTLNDNIVGAQLRLSAQPQYRLLGKDKNWSTNWGNITEDEFATWGDTTECDASRTQTFLGLTTQALSGALINGDALALVMWLPRADSRWATRLQMIESDRLATPPWLITKSNVRGGIEQDEFGAPIAYWITKKHPGDKAGLFHAGMGTLSPNQDDWQRIPAFTPWGRRRVIHLYDKKRSGQSRGKSIFASVMREFRIAGEYLGHELQAAASNALIAAFLESDLNAEQVAELFGSGIAEATSYWKTVCDSTHRKKMEGGMMLNLPLGAKLSGYNPNRPNTAFDSFMESVMRHLAAGLNMPYELVLKDFSKTTYSSARAALLEAWRYFQTKRRWLRDQWLDPIYECWLEEAINENRVEAPDYYKNRYAYNRCRWIFSGRGWVDPVKEVVAVEKRLALCISTQQDECAEQGKDFQEVQDQRVREFSEAMAKVKPLNLPVQLAYQLALKIAGFSQDGITPGINPAIEQHFADAQDPEQTKTETVPEDTVDA
jgi:lambda family phage portal protein